jgi:hypothetical protein
MRRREFLGTVGAGLVAARTPLIGAQTPAPAAPVVRKGRIKQGVTRGVFARGAALDDCCREAARLGIKGFDLIGPADWPTLKKYGLVPSMYQGTAGTIPERASTARRTTTGSSDAARGHRRSGRQRRPELHHLSPATATACRTPKGAKLRAFLNKVKAQPKTRA